MSLSFPDDFSSCDSWSGHARRAAHLDNVAKFGASMASAIGKVMAYYGAPPVRHGTGRI